MQQTTNQMFSRFTVKPVLKRSFGHFNRPAVVIGIRKSSDSAIDRALQESYDGIMPRLAAIGVRIIAFNAELR